MKTLPFGASTRAIYAVLLTINILVLAASAFLTYQVGVSEHQHLARSGQLADQLALLHKAETAAGEANAPGNDVFISLDPSGERARRVAASAGYWTATQTLRSHLGGEESVLRELTGADHHMARMTANSDDLFRLFGEDEVDRAVQAMAEMDREYGEVRKSLWDASALVRAHEAAAFVHQSAHSQRLARQQIASVAFMAIMVFALLAFGRRLRTEADAVNEREEVARSLAAREEELRKALAERDSRTEDLMHNEALLVEAQRIARTGAWEWDIATDTVWWSEGLHRIFGTDPETFQPSFAAYLAAIVPEDRERVAARIARSVEDRAPFEHEYGVMLANGERGVHLSSGLLDLDPDGNPRRLFGVSQDITELKRDEEQLLRQEAQLAEAQRIARVGSWEFDVVSRNVAWSDALHEILGYESGEVVPSFEAYMSLVPGEERRRVNSLLDRAMTSGKGFEFEHALVRRDGAELTMFVQGVITRDERGRAVRVAAISQDVTERANAEKKLRRSEERFHLASRATSDVIWDWDLVTNDVWVNEAFASQLGYPRWGEIDISVWAEALHPGDAAGVHASLEAAIEGDASVWSCEYRFRSFGGEWREVKDRAHIVRDAEGKAVRIIGAMMDISERRAIDRMKDEFISTVSHELRTPLTSIRGALGLLSSGRLGALPAKGERLLEIASNNTDRLVRLINDILDIERIESGKIALTKTTCDAAALAHSAADLVRGLAERESITLAVDAQPAAVVADSDRIVQTLTNLLGNSVKFSPPHSAILLSVRTEGNNVLFSVADQGRGIPPDKLSTIFERFQQVDASDSRDKGGSGLGLAICRSIVTQHGGEIRVASEEGLGSTFTVSIPSGATSEKPSAPDPENSVYVCDDDQDTRDALTFFLSKRGYRVVETATGQALLDAVQSAPPDAIILDLFMPDLNGWETLARLKSDPLSAKIPVIIASVLSQNEVGATNLELSGWVQKPLDERALAEVVERAFRGKAKRPRLVLVEDDDDLASVIVESFDRHGIETIHARNGREAIHLANSMEPDLLILDLALPGVDGFGVIDWLKDHSLWHGVPVVVYSATEPSPSQKDRLRLGHTEFMTKSHVAPEELERRIVRLLDTLTTRNETSVSHGL